VPELANHSARGGWQRDPPPPLENDFTASRRVTSAKCSRERESLSAKVPPRSGGLPRERHGAGRHLPRPSAPSLLRGRGGTPLRAAVSRPAATHFPVPATRQAESPPPIPQPASPRPRGYIRTSYHGCIQQFLKKLLPIH
jgi:hypothetical protein